MNGDVIATATLDNHEAALSLANLLPMPLQLNDFVATERTAELTYALPLNALTGHKPAAGDICYYVPWGSLTIFLVDHYFSNGLIGLGKLNSGLDVLRRAGSVKVIFERATP